MKVRLNYRKSLHENINEIYEEIKKLKNKIKGAEEAIKELENKLRSHEESQRVKQKIVKERRFWFEKFRWFITSKGHLFVAGKDATSNEILIKKYLEENDLVFHTSNPGSPFGILKLNHNIEQYFPKIYEILSKNTNEIDEIEECCIFIGSFSKLWKQGIGSCDAFYVHANQVSKKTPSGEYISKGSFMIYGEKNIIKVTLGLAITKIDNDLICGPIKTIEYLSNLFDLDYFILKNGGGKKFSEIVKIISKHFSVTPDDVQRIIPSGNAFIHLISPSKNKTLKKQ
ncbi:MAG: NFACT RNA binding domain-containing protein [Candidatus Woesearchaeota archaeon]